MGATAVHSFGPLCRFVSGTAFSAQALTRKVQGRRAATAAAASDSDLLREAAEVE
jgi:hypothetical protein